MSPKRTNIIVQILVSHFYESSFLPALNILLCDPKLSTVLKDNRTERKEAVLEPRVDPGDPGGVALTIENLQEGKGTWKK